MQVTSKRGLSYLQSSVLAWRRRIRHRVDTNIEICDNETRARFHCASAIEERRAVSLFEKERGTIEWLRKNVRTGQVFVDIGANIGIYTVLAAQLTGPSGKVFAFEPHAVNFSSLMANIALNDLENVCVPIATALSDKPGHVPFYYASLTAGSSMSQLGQSTDPDGRRVDQGIREMKAATSVDHLVSEGIIAPPDHIKIDVDGIEADIVRGMRNTLNAPDHPQTVQVEIQQETRLAVIEEMEDCGFQVDHVHHTASGQAAIASGKAEEEITHNIVFTRKAA